MTSFGYRLNPRYAIKECSSCETLYTRDCSCSKGNVEDKILVPKPPKNCARCARCGHSVNRPYCQGCTLLREKLEKDLVTYFQNFQNTSESSNDSTNVVNAPREPFIVKKDHGVNPSHIDECAHIGYNCPRKVPIISNPKPCNQTMNNELPQTLPSFDSTCYFDKENSVPCVSKPNLVDESSNIFKKKQEEKRISCEFCESNAQYGHYYTPQVPFIIPEPSYSQDSNYPQDIHDFQQQYFCCDQCGGPHETLQSKDHFEIVMNSNDDISSSDDDSLYNENIEYVEASPHDSELVSLEAAEIVIPEVEEIEDDNLHKKLLNVHLLIANIEALKDNPTPSSELLTKSSSTYPKYFLEETNTFHNSLPEFENFYFDLEEISSGSTTTHYDISLSDYEAFYFDDDYIEDISSGNTTTHFDISLSEYDSFTFNLANDQFPPTDRSDFANEEFVDELAHIISPPEICENLSTICVNLPIEDDHSPLLAYVVWIFLAYLTYPVIPPYLHPFGNEDTIFDPGITINHFRSFKPGLSHRCEAFKKFNTHRSHLNE
uniref:Pre-mRNA splicing Prp18-interacting factor n=1 Tax=Tanacetum cinerariifolium TaxID=118510 RepID=A0A699J215_TANCI|nr:hypothetical protein [Tanacetum cinerariifolium]